MLRQATSAHGSFGRPLICGRLLQVEIGEEEPEDVAVRRYMKAVMQSGVINKVLRVPWRRGCSKRGDRQRTLHAGHGDWQLAFQQLVFKV